MENWLVLDEGLKSEWESEASKRASDTVGRPIQVSITLPTEEEARRAYRDNEDLLGQIKWVDDHNREFGVFERLPFHGVFILRNPGERHAQASVWNSYLEPVPDSGQAGGDIDDLSNRMLRTFPRQLIRAFCRRIGGTKANVFDEAYWTRTVIVPVKSWLMPRVSLLRRVRPNNAADLMAQICGVRRYVVSRTGAMGFPPAKRMNHPSYDGRICPVDTPESELVGISLQLARGARVDKDGLIHPAEGGKVLDRISWGAALIPFSHHNDGVRDMMGAKNLRQATPVLKRERPAVRTGAERDLALKMAPLMRIGICPDSTDGKGETALGRDLLVAYLPWNGWNVDDAVVVSQDVVDRGLLSVLERKTFSRPILPKYRLVEQGGTHQLGVIRRGEAIARFEDKRTGAAFVVAYNDEADAKLTSLSFGSVDADAAPMVDGRVSRMLTYEIEREIPLGRGDKLMARHGNKGVVGKIERTDALPRLPDDARLPAEMRGKPIDILVNPHGVLSRMNPGQLLETHLGWLFKAVGVSEDEVRVEGRSDEIGAPEVDVVNFARVQELLEQSGLDRRGRIKLVLPDGNLTEYPIVVGYEHFVRLHHMPELKAQARAGGAGYAYNAVTQQPVQGRTCGGGQRLGEMEVWALHAYGADRVLEEMLGGKSDRDWSAAWREAAASEPPSGRDDASGEDRYGFPHLLKDWLRALCIDVKMDKETAQFRFLSDADELVRLIEGERGIGRQVVALETCKEVEVGRFGCKTCDWMMDGDYPRDAKGHVLKFGALLRTLGFDRAGSFRRVSNVNYVLELMGSDGQPAGELDVQLENYKPDAQTMNLVVSPSQTHPPRGWPDRADLKVLCLRAKPAATKQECKKYNLSARTLTAKALLQEVLSGTGRRVEDDFSVVCPHHRHDMLRLKQLRDVALERARGGLFDRAIFDGKDAWGYIRLPVAIDYPYWATENGRKDLKTFDGVKISVIPVLPLHYRRPVDRATLAVDREDISHSYLEILRVVQSFGPDGESRSAKNIAKLQRAVADLFGMLGGKLEGKYGLLRHDGLGRRVDRSFRLVIAPNPELDWDQAGIPASILWEMLGDRISGGETPPAGADGNGAGRIERQGGWTWHNGRQARDAYQRVKVYLERHPEFVVVLNRQPSLHRDSMQAFHPVAMPPEDGEVLQLSPLCCEGFAADFDGDEMTGHVPVSASAQDDARKMLPSRNVRSVATGNCLAHLDRDLVTGLELMHRNPEKYAAQLEAAGVDEGVRAVFADQTLAPGEAAQRVFEYLCEKRPDDAAILISKLSRVAFRACTAEGVSFGFFDLLHAEVAQKELDNESGDWVVRNDMSPFAVMVNAGANGSRQIRQVVHERGKLDVGKDLPPVDIGGVSLVDGMPWRAYFDAAQNARYSMSLKKVGVQKAGVLTRQLVLGMWDWTICRSDCGCDETERSVLNCRCCDGPGYAHRICARCFGKLPNGREPEDGMPIGLIAAQSLGERGTQLSMRVFHAGSMEIDLDEVAGIMTGSQNQKMKNAEEFVKALRVGAYAGIDRRYFELLWKVLQFRPDGKLSGKGDDPFTALARGSQMKTIRAYAHDGKRCSLRSPVARVFFDLFGNRAGEER